MSSWEILASIMKMIIKKGKLTPLQLCNQNLINIIMYSEKKLKLADYKQNIWITS